MAYEPTNTWESMDFKSLGGFLSTKREELKKFFDEHTVDGQYKMTEDEVKEVRDRNDELGRATKRWEQERELDATFQKNRDELRRLNEPDRQIPHPNGGEGAAQQPQVKSLGELFTEHDSYKNRKNFTVSGITEFAADFPEHTFDGAEMKATITTAAGFAPFNTRLPRVVGSAQRRPVVADLIPNTQLNQQTILFMEETTFTNAAAPVAENAAKPESALAWTQRSQPMEVIGTFVPITNQQLDFVPQIRSTVDNRLRLMLELAEETQLLSGSGTTPQLLGFYNKSGIQTQAKGTDPVPDAIYKAFTKIRHTGFAEPSGVVLHPNDWQDIRLLRTADGIYIWGNPSEAGPERVWGKTVVVTSAATENTGLAADFQLYSEIFRAMGVRIVVGRINDDLVKNKQTILIEEYVSLVIYRAASVCTITGI